MVKNVLPTLILAAVCISPPVVAAAQQHDAEQPRDLRVEHADVPMYPQAALNARISGTVEVQVTVTDGNVTHTEVKSGPPILARAVVENIQSWRFYKLVNSTFTAQFIYQIGSKEPLDPQNPKVELQLPLLVKITTVAVPIDTMTGQTARP